MKMFILVLFALVLFAVCAIAPCAYAGDYDKALGVELLDVGYADVIQLAEVKVEALTPAARRQAIESELKATFQELRRQQLNIGYRPYLVNVRDFSRVAGLEVRQPDW